MVENGGKRNHQAHKPVSKVPPPIKPVGTSYIPPDAKRNHMLTSWPPSFPNDLQPQATVIIRKALKKFPFQGWDSWHTSRQPETLQFLKCVISDMIPLLRSAVQSNTLRRDSVLSVMSELLHYLLVSSCDGSSDERYELEQKTIESDEWAKLANEMARVGSEGLLQSQPRETTGHKIEPAEAMEAFEDGVTMRGKARAEMVARIKKELDNLKPQMFGEDAYAALEMQHPDFCCFEITKKRNDLKLKVVSLQGHRQHMRLAQELAAEKFGLELSTIQTAWKKYKPDEFRKKSA